MIVFLYYCLFFLNVNLQLKNNNSVLSFYKKFISFRKNNLAILKGDQVFLQDDDVLIFKRSYGVNEAICIFNFNDDRHIIKNYIVDEGHQIEISHNSKLLNNNIELNRYGFMIITIENQHKE